MPTDTELPTRGPQARGRDTAAHTAADDVRPGHAAPGRGEVELGSIWSRVLRLWWVVLVVAVVVAGFSLRGSSETPQRYQASATIYLGQPVTPSGALLNTVTSKATTAIQIATSDAAMQRAVTAVEATGATTTKAKVKAGLSVVSVSSAVASKLLNPPTLIQVTSKLPTGKAANAAATAVSAYLVDQTNGYVDARQDALNKKVTTLQASIADLQAQRAIAVKGAGANADNQAGATYALLLATVSTDQRLAQADLDDAQGQLQTSQELERSNVVTRPSASKVTVAGGRSSVVVAIFLGLVVGIAAALALSFAGLGRRRRGVAPATTA